MSQNRSTTRARDHQLAPGHTIADRYRVVCLIGQGGMGSVYELTHERLDRQFAAKVLARELAGDRTSLARFRREAEIIAGLRHPNIVDIVDWETLEDGTPCMIMEYLHGESLGARITREAPLPWSQIHTIGRQVLNALVVAHREGIVHRDLKPDNIFLSKTDSGEEVVKLLDFGVSKIRDSNTMETQDHTLLGTPSYMSPEQADARPSEVDETTDLWAMGAILYEMAAGRTAFRGQSIPSLLYQICYRDPDPLVACRGDAAPAFVHLIGRALSRDRARRWPSAAEMLTALTQAASLLQMRPDRALGHVHDTAPAAPMLRARDDITEPFAHSMNMPIGLAQTMDATGDGLAHHGFTGLAHTDDHAAVRKIGPRKRGVSIALAVLLLGVGLALGLMLSRSPAAPDATAPTPTPTTPVPLAAPAAQDASVPSAADTVADKAADTSVSDQAADQPADKRADKRTRSQKSKKRADKIKADKTKKGERKKGEPVNPFANTP